MEQKAGNSGYVVNSISGAASKSPSQSPGQRRRYDNEHRGINRTPQGKGTGRGDRRDSSQGRRSRESNNTRLCYKSDKITTHLPIYAPSPKKRREKLTKEASLHIQEPESHQKTGEEQARVVKPTGQ